MLSEKCYRKAIFLLDETARVGYNTRVLGTRRKTGSWVQKGPFHRVVGLPLIFGSGGDFLQGGREKVHAGLIRRKGALY